MWNEKRKVLRHLVQLPIKYCAVTPSDKEVKVPQRLSKTKDISPEGLLFLSPQRFETGSLLNLSVPTQGTVFTVRACVAHICEDVELKLYRIGVQFLNPDGLFKIKMAEQLYQIGQYQRKLSEKQGRQVSKTEAAELWIEEHSKEFAQFYL